MWDPEDTNLRGHPLITAVSESGSSGSGSLRLVHSLTLRASPALLPIILKICLNLDWTAKMGELGVSKLKDLD